MSATKNSELNGAANDIVNGTEQKLKIKAGMITDLKNVYEGKPDRRGRSTWVDKYPDDIEEAAENAETACYALIIRNKKCYDGRKQLETDSIHCTVAAPEGCPRSNPERLSWHHHDLGSSHL